MEIEVAKHSGFCFGVKEAMKKAEKTIENCREKSKKIYTYGPLIHNTQVNQELKNKGVVCVNSINDVEKGSTIIVRSHGVPKSFYEEAKKKELEVIDATCVFVRKVQQKAQECYGKGKQVVIIGNKNHPEVIGINGWCNESAIIIENECDAEKITGDNICVVAQTTITESLWEQIEKVLDRNLSHVEYYNTICSATEERQKSCLEVSKRVDAMIVIGGKHSSNSQKLYAIAKKNCKKSCFIETKHDLPLNDFKKCNKIGVAAGASTPERIIKEVITIMSELSFEGETENMTDSTPQNQMEELMEEIEKSLRIPGRGEIIKGTIIQVRDNEVIVNLGCKKDGIIPKDEITTDSSVDLNKLFNIGDDIEAQVLKTDDGEGNLLLSKRRLDAYGNWNEIVEIQKENSAIEVKVKNKVKGGVIAVYKELTGFIPISQLSNKFVENMDEYVGQVLKVKIVQLDKKKNKIIFSHRTYLDEERAKKIEQVWNSIAEGDSIEGKVMRFTNYGAFVDIGGIDGLLHISEISWGKINHPSDALEIGQKIKVKVLSIDNKNEKVSLGLKQTTPEPWAEVDKKFNLGDIIEGKVVQIKDYGVFVEIEPGMDGLVHISEMSYNHVANPATEVELNQIVKAKILDIDKENKRISLSIKETLEKPEEEVVEEANTEAEEKTEE